ncbi:MAG: DUF2652 domain-containing protein [Deltaproteobacteria bacterium]|nr:DUF2652 domain-containing protein [Deltaproteobacteria bacterium]
MEHGPLIIAELLEEVVRHIAPPLEVIGIEGDAIFARAVDGAVQPAAALLDVLRAGFAGFRDRQRALQADESCACGACRAVWRLRLKAIGHYGPFLQHRVAGRAQIAGADVILAHRLLKNGVGRTADYALLTREALREMDVDPARLGFMRHVEHYEHFGAVECFVADLTATRPRAA